MSIERRLQGPFIYCRPELSILFRLAGAALEQPEDGAPRDLPSGRREDAARPGPRSEGPRGGDEAPHPAPGLVRPPRHGAVEVQTAQASAEQQRGWTGALELFVWLLLHT